MNLLLVTQSWAVYYAKWPKQDFSKIRLLSNTVSFCWRLLLSNLFFWSISFEAVVSLLWNELNNCFPSFHSWRGKYQFSTICRNIFTCCNCRELICKCHDWCDSTDDWGWQWRQKPFGLSRTGHLSFVEQGPAQMFLCIKAVDWHICEFLLAKTAGKTPNLFLKTAVLVHLCGLGLGISLMEWENVSWEIEY